jgi:hypothetical protein
MKKIIVTLTAVIAMISVITPAIASGDYIVVKEDGRKITIYNVESNNQYTWLTTYNYVNPTVAQLSETNLPESYWGWTNGEKGVFDTRLEKAKQDLEEMKANYENSQENVNYLEDQMGWNKVYQILWGIALIAMVIVAIAQRSTIKNLKQNQK